MQATKLKQELTQMIELLDQYRTNEAAIDTITAYFRPDSNDSYKRAVFNTKNNAIKKVIKNRMIDLLQDHW